MFVFILNVGVVSVGNIIAQGKIILNIDARDARSALIFGFVIRTCFVV